MPCLEDGNAIPAISQVVERSDTPGFRRTDFHRGAMTARVAMDQPRLQQLHRSPFRVETFLYAIAFTAYR